MKKFIFFISLLIISSGNLFAQNIITTNNEQNGIMWQNTFGGSGDDYAVDIINTLDTGFAILGNVRYTGSPGFMDISIVKIDKAGNFKWEKKIHGINNSIAYSLIQTSDSCYIIAGATNSSSYDFYEDMFLVKLRPTGELIWSKTFGTDGWDRAYRIKSTPDNGFIVVGYSELSAQDYGLMIIKFREDGNMEWSRFADKTGSGLLFPDLILTNDNGIVIATTINDIFGTFDITLLKLDDFGRHQFSWVIGGASVDEAKSVIQTSDNGYAIAGYTASFGAGAPDLYIVKLSVGGTLQWTRTIGGSNDDYGFSIFETYDGNYIIGGEGFSFGNGGFDFYFVKLDNNGKFLSANTFGSPEIDYFRSIVHDYDGGFLTVGSTGPGNYRDFYIVKTDSLGRTCGSSVLLDPHIDSGGSVKKYPVNIYPKLIFKATINAVVSNWGNYSNLCLTKTSINSHILPSKYELFQNYPNPFNPVTKINFEIPLSRGVNAAGGRGVYVKLNIFDITGREIKTLVDEQLQPGSYSVDWDATGYASGVYFYSLVTVEFSETKRMVLIK